MRIRVLLALSFLVVSSCTQVSDGKQEDDSKAVMTAVLEHFSKRTNTSSLEEDGVILIRPATATWPEGTFSGLAPMDDQPRCQAAQELYDRFVERNRKEGAAAELFDNSERWRAATSSELDQMPLLVSTSDGKRLKTVMTLYAPGFSVNGREAFVLLAFSWSIHGARAGYVLDKVAGKWTVKCSLLNFAL